MSQSFDLFVLVTSVPSKIWILLKYSLYNIQTFIEKYIVVIVIFILICNWLNEYSNIMESQCFSIGKEVYESILILAKLWLILYVVPLFPLIG